MSAEKETDPSQTLVVQLGNGVRIPMDSVIKCPRLIIGDHTRINGAINVRGKAECRIGKYCAFGYGIHIITSNHATGYPNMQISLNRKYGFADISEAKGPVEVGHGVWIGDNVTVLSGDVVGHGAVVGAESIVTRDLPPFSVSFGNPARVHRFRFSEAVIKQMLDVDWWNWSASKIERNEKFFSTDFS